MKRHLYTKFIISYLIVAIVGFLVISLFISRLTFNLTLENEARALYRQATSIASRCTYVGSMTGYLNSEMNHSDMRAAAIYLDSDIMLLWPNGNVIYDFDGFSGHIEDFDAAIGGNKYYFTGDFFGTFPEKYLTVIAPVTIKYKLNGYVLLHKKISTISAISNTFLNYNYITYLIMLVLFGISMAVRLISIYKPMNNLMGITKDYAEGNFKNRSAVKRNDEFGDLAKSLDNMASEIQKLNDYQSKFIANISHDFRSPLTSIKGYIEAMIDGTIPVEMQPKYLNIVLFETERLNKLTSNLLTMNNLGQGMLLDITTFDINDVIKNTIMTFEGSCAKRKIKFNLTFSDRTAYVMGDLGKIQQVVYNLVDNAIKFSNNDSYINITTTEKTDRIFVSVKDFGIGIPKNSINKIWDRFYKSDLSRGKDKKGTGLGLSIVKEIINAHNTTIDVISTEGAGTEFVFSLPKKNKD